eukprot:COSAG01_NODE_37963_length_496_cov_1.327456_1_plen_92_part_10
MEPEPDEQEEGVPPMIRSPANQGEWGECVVYATFCVVQEQLQAKFDTALEDSMRAILVQQTSAYNGLTGVEPIAAKLREEGSRLKLKAGRPS